MPKGKMYKKKQGKTTGVKKKNGVAKPTKKKGK